MVRMPAVRSLLKRPSGTPLTWTAPGASGSALMLCRWKRGSGSFIVSRRRPRIWISAVSRWYAVKTSTLVQEEGVLREPAVCITVGWYRTDCENSQKMRLDDARRGIRERSELHAFIIVSAEEGDGPVVAVKDLVDVKGMPTTAGGVILPREPAPADAPLIRTLRER